MAVVPVQGPLEVAVVGELEIDGAGATGAGVACGHGASLLNEMIAPFYVVEWRKSSYISYLEVDSYLKINFLRFWIMVLILIGADKYGIPDVIKRVLTF